MKEGKWDTQIKATFHDTVFTSSLKEGKIAVQFKGVPLKPEGEVGIANLLLKPDAMRDAIAKDPSKLFKLASLKFTLPGLESDVVQLGNRIPELRGISVQLKLTPKAVFSIVPSPVLIERLAVSIGSRLGTAGGPIAAGIVIAAAWTILSLHLIDLAHKRGERWADVVNFRRGYARRLAAEAADWRAGKPPGNFAWNKARAKMEPGRYEYKQLYEGWQAADEAIKGLPPGLYDAGMKSVRDRFGRSYSILEDEIFEKIGGAADSPIQLPANPTLIE